MSRMSILRLLLRETAREMNAELKHSTELIYYGLRSHSSSTGQKCLYHGCISIEPSLGTISLFYETDLINAHSEVIVITDLLIEEG